MNLPKRHVGLVLADMMKNVCSAGSKLVAIWFNAGGDPPAQSSWRSRAPGGSILLAIHILAANSAGYARGDTNTWEPQADRSTTIRFEHGPWRMHDNFFGGEPYGGREVVFFGDRPVWMLLYYGWVAESEDSDRVYKDLRQAMCEMPPEHPYRGPARFEGEGFVYTNTWEGDLENLRGGERIYRGLNTVYTARYVGGWVDRRVGT